MQYPSNAGMVTNHKPSEVSLRWSQFRIGPTSLVVPRHHANPTRCRPGIGFFLKCHTRPGVKISDQFHPYYPVSLFSYPTRYCFSRLIKGKYNLIWKYWTITYTWFVELKMIFNQLINFCRLQKKHLYDSSHFIWQVISSWWHVFHKERKSFVKKGSHQWRKERGDICLHYDKCKNLMLSGLVMYITKLCHQHRGG